MKIDFNNFPKTKEGTEFEQMFMAMFLPLKNHIQYHNLQDRLTEEDLQLLAHAVIGGAQQWCQYLKMANARREER